MLGIKFFGTSAAVPSKNRGFSCIGVYNERQLTLLDCGDGSIHRLIKSDVDVSAINDIFVTHYHSDHVTGLTSIIETMAIQKKSSNLNVYGPPGLTDYFSTVERITRVAFTKKFQINLVELQSGQGISIPGFAVSTFAMDHTVPCLGYRLKEEKGNGRVIAYTGDTQPCECLLPLARNTDLLIHEATFLQKDVAKARPPKHATPTEAANAALSAGAKKLVLTHVNDDDETPEEMISEAKAIWRETIVADDGLELEV
ncbi:MAG TPA: ribonuclease Z [Nitrososphaerales archaeon]|nr:ribonuclease Z [Nitrososphaerales archaeon]